jgi:hypothetical protein
MLRKRNTGVVYPAYPGTIREHRIEKYAKLAHNSLSFYCTPLRFLPRQH